MKKAILALALVLACSVAGAALVNNAVAVTQTSQTLTVGTANAPAMSILVVNEGANEVFVCLFSVGETPVACTTSTGFKINMSESVQVTHAPTEAGGGYIATSLVCSAGETATARVWAK